MDKTLKLEKKNHLNQTSNSFLKTLELQTFKYHLANHRLGSLNEVDQEVLPKASNGCIKRLESNASRELGFATSDESKRRLLFIMT